MTGGIRAEVSIDGPADCPIATVSGAAGEASYTVSKSVPPGEADTVTEEFVVNDGTVLPELEEDVDEVFSYGDQQVYRFTRERGIGCPCEQVEQFDCPIVDVYTRDGVLNVAFHAPDMETLSDALSAIRGAYPGVTVRRLLRSDTDREENDLVFVDRGKLTERQREVLETAHDMGYFDHPKGANAGEVATALDITSSTFSEHLAAAQRKLLEDLLDA
jgi:predicted DNA binding protein